MQAARRALGSAGLLASARRGMTTAAQAAVEGKPTGSIVDTIGVYTAVPVAIGVFIYDVVYPEEEFEGEIPPYPYMRMRDAKQSYPWGPDGLFELHRRVGEKP